MASKQLVPEQQSFVRLTFACVDEVRVVLGDILYSQIPPEQLYRKIHSNRHGLIGNNRFSPEQLKLCYIPGPLLPNYKSFDVTLLYKLIRNLCPILQPSQGWGQQPQQMHINVGDDIERLRIFRNELVGHIESFSVSIDVFDSRWRELEHVFKRIQAFFALNGITKDFVEQLACIKRTDFGLQDYEKNELRLLIERNRPTDTPKLTLQCGERKNCGESAIFEVTVGDDDLSNNWPVTWQKCIGAMTEQLDTSTRRYSGSSSRRLVIPRVSKSDQGEYRATVLREVRGTHIQIPSNPIYLTVTGDIPILEIGDAFSQENRLTIRYSVNVNDQSPAVDSVVWTKNGEPLQKNADKYCGGQLMDTYLMIYSPTSIDIGQYSCKVSNEVGFIMKSIHLNVPSVSIADDLQVPVGNPITIKATIQSCPTPVSAIWQKNAGINKDDFENLDINDSKYFGSKNDPEDPRLVIPKATHEDGIYYRLVVSNGIGQSTSNTAFLKLIGDLPSVSVHHETNILEKSVRFVCEMAVPIDSPEVSDVFWTKDDIKIDIPGSGGKYSGGSIVDPSLTIKSVNSTDKGGYQCCVSNSLGKMCSETILLDLPTIKLAAPAVDEKHGTITYNAAIKSIPVALKAEWKVKQDPSSDFQAIHTHGLVYRGSTVALPRPKLVVHKYKAEQRNSFQLEVLNFIGCSTRNIEDEIKKNTESTINKEISDSLKNFYSKRGSNVLFASLSNELVKLFPEDKLGAIKHVLLGLSEVDEESIKETRSVRDLFMLLQEKKLFTKTDVIFMQYLLKQTDCKILYDKCIEYAREQGALCFFEKPPENGYKHVQFHVAGDFEAYSEEDIRKIRETVAAILGCKRDDVVKEGIRPANSFILVLAIKETLISKFLAMNQHHMEQLRDLKVDYFILDKNLRNIAVTEKPTPLEGDELENTPGFERNTFIDRERKSKAFPTVVSFSQNNRSLRITIPRLKEVYHISVVTSDILWVSDNDGSLLQVDSAGCVVRIKHSETGSHTVTEDGDLLFIDDDKVHKLTSDGTDTTLLTTDWRPRCVYSSRINGEILVGSSGKVTRYDKKGQKLQVIKEDEKGRKLYGLPCYITENKNGDVWTSDMLKNIVVVVDKSRHHRFDYTGRQSDNTGRQYQSDFDPRGICTDILGHVLVCDYYDDSVHLLDQDGHFLSLLLTRKQHGLHSPTALCVDDQHNLYLGMQSSNVINVYKYLVDTEVE